jgi:hypothetical protein
MLPNVQLESFGLLPHTYILKIKIYRIILLPVVLCGYKVFILIKQTETEGVW